MRLIHIAAGLLAIVAGAVALCAATGSTLHRTSGRVSAIAMFVMASSAFVIAGFLRPDMGNVAAAVLVFYLVASALLTVRRTVEQARGLIAGLMFVALTLSALDFWWGFEALKSANGRLGVVPAPMLFIFGTVIFLAAMLDARMLWVGSIQGSHRLARHLWRMSFAMFVATASFFLGQPRFFPEPLRHQPGLRAIPVVLVILAMLYWLGRVLIKRERVVPLRHR